ncbi:MAG: nucleotide-binding protein [Gammaproteobacteria bacterium]
MTQPRIFIGSASETIGIVDALESQLREVAHIDRWDVDVFRPGHFTLEELTRMLSEVDFAIFVLGQEDRTQSRGTVTPSPRDNVLFEAGLFTSVLGRERVLYVVDKQGTKIPSDWAGLGYLLFDDSEERERDKVYDAVRTIRKQIADWQPSQSPGPLAGIVGHWWQFVINLDAGAVLSLLEITAGKNKMPRVRGEAWASDGEPVAEYWSQSARYDEENHVLHYSWEGEHPWKQEIPRYVGVGEITFFMADSELAKRGKGWFSTANLSDVKDAMKKSTVYFRASPEEVAKADSDERSLLLQEKQETFSKRYR